MAKLKDNGMTSKVVNVAELSFSINVQPGEAYIVDDAADNVNRTFEAYMRQRRFQGMDRFRVLAMAAFDISLNFIRLRNTKDDGVLSSRTEELADRIERFLDQYGA